MSLAIDKLSEKVKANIRDIKDFPKEGIVFKDITPVLSNGLLFNEIMDHFAERFKYKDIDKVAGIEARGFIFSSSLANKLGAGMVPIRKKGKLPYETISVTYDLEYGQDSLEIHKDAFQQNNKVILVDDVLATGGTMRASIDLLRSLSVEVVEVVFLIELGFLKGREKLEDIPIYSLINYL